MTGPGGGLRLSPLEILHPAGRAATAIVIGDGCPEALRPAAPPGEPADLVVVADSTPVAEARRRASPDGLVCLLRPYGRGLPLLCLPTGAAVRHLATADAAGWALRHLVFQTPARRTVAAAVSHAPPLVRALPHVTIVRPPHAPLAAWLGEHLDDGIPGAVVLTASPRGRRCTIRVVRAGRLTAVVKLTDGADVDPPTPPPGVEVPRLLSAGVHAGLRVVVESAVEGRAAAIVLGERPPLLGDVLGALARSLERWQQATATERVADRPFWEREVMAPARAVAVGLDDRDAYLAWLERRCAEAEGARVPAVAAHEDLTMANVLLRRGGRLGIVDWETARRDGVPLGDYEYAAVDAHAAADRYRDPAASFEAARRAPDVVAHRARLAAALGLPPAISELCTHACWLRHAANEAVRPEGTRPFLRIMRSLAAAVR